MSAETHERISVGGLNWKSILTMVVFVLIVVLAALLTKANIPLPAAIAITVAVVLTILWLLSSAKVSVTEKFLIVGGGFYKAKVAWSDVLLDQAEQLPGDSPFKLRWRINGLGWPGLSLGWFTTNRGKRVFAAVSGKKHRIYIPLTRDFDLIVTPSDPGALLAAMKSRHAEVKQIGS